MLIDQKHDGLIIPAFKKREGAIICYFGKSTLFRNGSWQLHYFQAQGLLYHFWAPNFKQEVGKTTEEWWSIYYEIQLINLQLLSLE